MSEEPLISDYHDDPDMRELLIEFRDSLRDSCLRLSAAVVESDVDLVKRIAHQLKGAGGGYGYLSITEAGARVEDAIRATGSINEEVRKLVDQLMHLCERACAGIK